MKFRLLKELPFAEKGAEFWFSGDDSALYASYPFYTTTAITNYTEESVEYSLIKYFIENRDNFSDWLEPIEEEKKPKRWRAEKGSKYVYLNDLWICSVEIEENDEVDDLRFQMHNYFKSREECGIYKEVLEVESELRGLADWNEDSPIKWQICFTGSGLRVYNETIYDGRAISFQTEESAQKAIDQIGESRLIKYLTYKF